MRTVTSLLAFLFALSLAIAPPVSNAQDTDFKLGPRAVIDVEDIDEFGIGADARLGLGRTPVQIHGSFDWYFVDDDDALADDFSLFTIDANAAYMFDLEDQNITPYAGGGVGITFVSIDEETESDEGLNLLGGAEFELDNTIPFVELQFTTSGDVDRLALSAGVLFEQIYVDL